MLEILNITKKTVETFRSMLILYAGMHAGIGLMITESDYDKTVLGTVSKYVTNLYARKTW